MYYPELAHAAFTYPAIDNHAHPLLSEKNRDAFPFEGITSEARGDILTSDSPQTLASYRATVQLSKLYGLKHCEPTWDALEKRRDATDYLDLCNMCFKPSGIQCLLLDDGLGDVAGLAEPNEWHDRFTTSPCKRIVRIESEAEDILRTMVNEEADYQSTSIVSVVNVLEQLTEAFKARLLAHAKDEHVVCFKSIIGYRTGLYVAPSASFEDLEKAVLALLQQYKTTGKLRLKQKALNDHLVRLALQIAGQHHKPVQFHTGVGDNDVRSARASPVYLQSLIEDYPNTLIVLLHASYPHTREAGYLASVYKNVYLDFGEVFPLVSGDGQRAVIRQMLELAPTNKILWSSDGHWWPEGYYLASVQAREALYEVLSDSVRREGLSEHQAIEIIQNVLFHNSNRLYKLGLEPNMTLL